ncbi:glycosyltransferase family 4 protein [Natronomonas sp. F2-12]|jgi:glycosyltransferase involved in cell wall biosynthesis|uniref:Glycosyltransferase family 4 protein n=1 Tax=Natronomonas aquatica TaxID=2841590 RepID=A0A9R1CVM4_9EURY|nr:glycosyltransferase family 4 protein [Natronomonas aquatica]MCQ4334700.1 glycosyltransferase family 4 protein [Natronomonas aquatica]
MRVGLTLYGDLEGRSGGFRYDRKLLDGLRTAGDTIEVIELPWRRYPRGLLDNVSPRFRDRLEVDVDVMLQDELAHPSLLGTNRRLPYPIVSIVHHLRASESRRLSPLYRTLERRYLETVEGVVCNSTATESVVTGLGVDATATVVAPPAGDRFDPPIDEEAIERRAREDPLRVVFVGNLTPRKGLKTLLEGLSTAETDAELTVVGRPVDGEYAATVRRTIRRDGLADRVRMAGELSDDELAGALRASHLLAVPSRYEGFGIVYLEGMSFGLPAIASRAGGATDVVTDGETGVLVDPGDPAAIARALTRLDGDRDRLAEMGKAARRRYESHPDWRETTARVRRLLEAVAAPEVRT